MSKHTDEIMNRLTNECTRRNIDFLANSENELFHLLHYPQRENPAFSRTIVDMYEDYIQLSSVLKTGKPKNPGPDYEKHVKEMLKLFLGEEIMPFYVNEFEGMVLSQRVWFEDKDAFTDKDVEHIFNALKHLNDTTTKLEEKIQAVFQ